MRRVLFRWRGVVIGAYPVCLYLGLVAGILVGRALASRAELDPVRFTLAATLLAAPALAGARLLHVLLYLSTYRRDPARLWRRTDAGAALYGGLLLALVVSAPVLRVLSLPAGAFWDVGAVVILVGMVFTKIGCLLNGCCAGRPTDGWLALYLPDDGGVWARRVPSPLLEAALAMLLLLGTALFWRRLAGGGGVFLVVLATYAAGRFFLESTRDVVDRLGGVSVHRAISVGLLMASVTLLILRLGPAGGP
jgi:phosphatidylglycerol---prolipoprotein diacylglyceryl transferase